MAFRQNTQGPKLSNCAKVKVVAVLLHSAVENYYLITMTLEDPLRRNIIIENTYFVLFIFFGKMTVLPNQNETNEPPCIKPKLSLMAKSAMKWPFSQSRLASLLWTRNVQVGRMLLPFLSDVTKPICCHD